MKRPTKLKDGCIGYTISYPNRINDRGDIGEIDYNRSTIQLMEDSADRHVLFYQEALLHEIGHLVNRKCGLRLEEEDIIAMTYVWLTLLRENPDVFEWLARG